MLRGRDARLARLTTVSTRVDATRGRECSALSAWKAACGIIRDGLAEAGFDPDRAAALRLGEGGVDLVERDGGPELHPMDEEFAAGDHDGLAGLFTARIAEISRRFHDGHEPDLASASMAELLAWVLCRRGS